MFALILEASYEQGISHNVRSLWSALGSRASGMLRPDEPDVEFATPRMWPNVLPLSFRASRAGHSGLWAHQVASRGVLTRGVRRFARIPRRRRAGSPCARRGLARRGRR